MTCRSFSFLVQFPLRPLKAISAPFGKEQNCAANCCPEERKEKTSPIATQQHKSRRKKSTITYDKHIYGTFDVAFTSTPRSLRGKLSICGYTSWHLAEQTSSIVVSYCSVLLQSSPGTEAVHLSVHSNLCCPRHQAPVSCARPGATVAFAESDPSFTDQILSLFW